MSARNRRSAAPFPASELFVQRIAVAGPNAATITADIDFDLEDKRIVRILGTEISAQNWGLATSVILAYAAVINPDKTLIGTVAEANDDDIIHLGAFEFNLVTTGGMAMRNESIRYYPALGISYGQQRFRFIFQSAQDLSGTWVSGAVYYTFDEVTQETALALLRRR